MRRPWFVLVATVALSGLLVISSVADRSFPSGLWPRILLALLPLAQAAISEAVHRWRGSRVSKPNNASNRPAIRAVGRRWHRIGIFLTGFWVLLALTAPAIVGQVVYYPLLLGMTFFAGLNWVWMRHAGLPPSKIIDRAFALGLITTLFVGVPLIAVVQRGLQA